MKKQLFLIALAWCTITGAVEPYDIFDAAENNNTDLVQQCIDRYGVVILKRRSISFGNTPLHCAAENNAQEAAQLILKKGGPELLEKKNNKGWTPLHEAIFDYEPNIIPQLLIKNGANVNSKCILGCTPLHDIVAYHKYCRGGDHTQLLLENGAKIHIKDKGGKTPCDLAASKEADPKIRELFKEHQNTLNRQLLEEIVNNDIEAVKSILKLGAKINVRAKGKENNSWTPLHIAVRHNHPKMVAFLLGYGAPGQGNKK